ncbi:MAG: response regulator [Anaerolineales bacterium]
MAQPRVMIVDDNPEVIRLVRDILATVPCEVLVAESGEEALAELRREAEAARCFDAVLLDVKLPGVDGFYVLKQMKSDAELQQIPVILLTAVGHIQDKTRGLQLGADDYITKPFDAQELLARVKVVLRIRHTERMLRRRNQDLAALNRINNHMTSSLELDRVLKAALEGLNDLLTVQALAIVLNDEETDTWMVRNARSPEGSWLEGRVISVDGAAKEALATRRPVLQRAVVESFWSEALDSSPLDLLFTPLLTYDEPVGLLVVIGEAHTLSGDQLPLLENVAANLSTAVENARLYGELTAFAEALERSQNQLIQAEKMAAVGRLAASIAHEINNPLQAIQNTMHLAAHPNVNEKRRQHYLEMAQQEVERLVHIVRRMLDFYRPASGLLKSLSINEAIRDALNIANKRFQQAHISHVTRFEAEIPAVWGSKNQLTQVFLNIIINAIEAMEKGGQFWVGTAYHAEDDRVIAAFRDNGPGIAPEAREHLFEPFNTTKPTGTGLGLAISYGIIERHGGTITVESPPNGGATFIVQLPAYHQERT